jgi:DNA-binding transcriptional MerR regulator
MDSLVVTKQAEAFDNAIRSFIIELNEEGFTIEDVKKYIQERQERIYFQFRNFDNEEK